MRASAAASVAALFLALSGCGPNGLNDQNSEKGGSTADAPGYKTIHQKVFSKSCTSQACHAGERGIANLSFAGARDSYDLLIDQEPTNGSAVQEGFKRVKPGAPDKSFLLTKLSADKSRLEEKGFGGPMPLSGDRLGSESLDGIRRWIEAGAPFEGNGEFKVEYRDEEEKEDAYVECDATDKAGLKDCFEPKPEPKEDFIRIYSPKIEVPAKTEVIACSYIDYRAAEDLFITQTQGQQMTGGHHSALFLANSPKDDYQPHECTDEEMSNYRFVAGAGGGGGQDTNMPEGSALTIDKGKQFVIQSHYINTKDEPVTVMDAIDIKTVDKSQVDQTVEPFATIISDFEIPAGASEHKRVETCKLEKPMDVYMLLGHTHDYGTLFEFESKRPEENSYNLMYHATDGPLLRDSPEIKMYDPPKAFPAGTKFRITCQWNNDTDHAITWPEEMCVALMYYGPGRGWLTCSNDDKSPTAIGGDGDGEGCASPYDMGNDLGVGEYCTETGDECTDNSEADRCLAPFDPSSNFCSIVGCETDEECGKNATCVDKSAGSACVPDKCLN